jgi:hypothetical protein
MPRINSMSRKWDRKIARLSLEEAADKPSINDAQVRPAERLVTGSRTLRRSGNSQRPGLDLRDCRL